MVAYFDYPLWAEVYSHYGCSVHPEGYQTWDGYIGREISEGPYAYQVIYVTGEESQRLIKGGDSDRRQTVDDVVDRLDEIWNGARQAYDSARASCKKKGCSGEVEFFPAPDAYPGAYSKNDDVLGETFKLERDGLIFAGSYFSDFFNSGYVSGAIDSGMRAAKSIRGAKR